MLQNYTKCYKNYITGLFGNVKYRNLCYTKNFWNKIALVFLQFYKYLDARIRKKKPFSQLFVNQIVVRRIYFFCSLTTV